MVKTLTLRPTRTCKTALRLRIVSESSFCIDQKDEGEGEDDDADADADADDGNDGEEEEEEEDVDDDDDDNDGDHRNLKFSKMKETKV